MLFFDRGHVYKEFNVLLFIDTQRTTVQILKLQSSVSPILLLANESPQHKAVAQWIARSTLEKEVVGLKPGHRLVVFFLVFFSFFLLTSLSLTVQE